MDKQRVYLSSVMSKLGRAQRFDTMYIVSGVYYVVTFIGYSKYLRFARVKRHKPVSFPLL